MNSILEEFFYGNISPQVQFVERDPHYDEVVQVISSAEDKLLERLGQEERELFLRYTEAQVELSQLTAIKSQIHGYKLGMLMSAEAFVTGGNLIIGG
ncbi:MAG: hypothetical protein FWE19_08770 [Oscillospiraceae bacterium]|nr:hypothetical protein [Oscillospiraceae bacterium]